LPLSLAVAIQKQQIYQMGSVCSLDSLWGLLKVNTFLHQFKDRRQALTVKLANSAQGTFGLEPEEKVSLKRFHALISKIKVVLIITT